MAASPGLRASFVLLLVASVGAKFAIGNPSLRVVETTMEKSAKAEIAAFLNRQGFRVDNIQDQTDSPFVSAIAGSCRLIAMAAAPQGWHRGLLQQLAKGQDQELFVYGAAVYRDQPIWLTWTDHYWSVLNRYAGRNLPTRLVLGIVASPTCNLRDMPVGRVSRTAMMGRHLACQLGRRSRSSD